MMKGSQVYRMSRLTAVLLIVPFLLAACGGAAAPTPPTGVEETTPATGEAATAPAQQVIVRYRTPPWASSQDTRIERKVAFRSVIESFNEQYASQGCQVVEVVADDNPVNTTQDIEQKAVDAYWFNFGDYWSRAAAGQLLDLTPYLEGELDNFFGWVQESLRSTESNKVYALWHNTDTPLYYYNTEKIQSAPKTWSELTALAERIRRDEGGETYGVALPYVGIRQRISGMLVALNGQWVDEQGAPVVFQGENREALRSLLQDYVDIYRAGLVPPGNLTSDNVAIMPDVFAGNVYSFVGNSNFHLRQLKPNLPAEEYEKWTAAPVPYPDAASQGRYEAGGWMIGAVPSGDAATDACAAKWVIHATGAEAQATTNAAGGWVPTRPAIIQNDPFFKDDPYYQTTLAALENGYVLPPSGIWAAMSTAIDTALQRAAQGEITVEEALVQAEAETMREYEAIRD